MGENTELIWVDKALAKKYKKIKDPIEQYKIIEEIINKKKIDITSSIEALDEDVLRFKAISIKHRNELQKALDDQLDKIEIVYDRVWKKEEQIKNKLAKIENLLSPVEDKIDTLTNKIANIQTYKIQELLEVIRTLNSLDKKTKELLKIMFNEYSDNLEVTNE